MTTVPATKVFRILVLDDEESMHDIVRENLTHFGERVRVDYARNAEAASELLAERLYDLALLDVYGKDNLLIGLEVYRRIDAAELSTRVLLMTRFSLKEDGPRLLELTGSPSAWRLAGFLDKTGPLGVTISGKVGKEILRFEGREASVAGLSGLAREIKRQRYRYKGRSGDIVLRETREEICTEVDRLLRSLYVDLPGGIQRSSHVTVNLATMDRRGLSAAVVVNATVSVTFAGLESASGGHKTVLKIGPKNDVYEEAVRFYEYVRYGVELTHRVELLGVAGVDALGGLVYSFAGGTYNHDLVSLDEILVEDLTSGDLAFSSTALQSLFSTKSWYAVSCEPVDAGDYFGRNYKTNLRRSCFEGEKKLFELKEKWREWPKIERAENLPEGRGVVMTTPSNVRLPLPDVSVLGWGRLNYRAPSCLVHGDMHGGNVMLECSSSVTLDQIPKRYHHRTCLIDFRHSGPGPRCIDAVCLESSIRLADAVVTSQQMDLRNKPLTADMQATFADELAGRFLEEKALYRAIFFGDGKVPDTEWATLCADVLNGLKLCFEEVSLREYLAISVRYTLRSLGFGLDEITRFRMATWLAAQFELATELGER